MSEKFKQGDKVKLQPAGKNRRPLTVGTGARLNGIQVRRGRETAFLAENTLFQVSMNTGAKIVNFDIKPFPLINGQFLNQSKFIDRFKAVETSNETTEE